MENNSNNINIINISNSPNNKNNNQQNEDSYSVLDNIENELKIITNTFFSSLKDIRTFAPFISKDNETNMEKSNYNGFSSIPNYEENRNNFDNMLDLTNKLKKFDEFNMKEEDLKKKLEHLKHKNINSTNNMEKKLNEVEKILNDLNMDQSMSNEINKREQFEQDIDYI